MNRIQHRVFFALLLATVSAQPVLAQSPSILHAQVDELAAAINDQVVEWRRDIHANPELGMQEFRTAALVADHLRSLGIDVTTEVGGTGVLGVLEGGRPGPVVALRADMDGLPVTELADVPFASKARAEWQGKEVGVVPLEVQLPDKLISTGYGVHWPPEPHDLPYYERVARAAGFEVAAKKVVDRWFYLELTKP